MDIFWNNTFSLNFPSSLGLELVPVIFIQLKMYKIKYFNISKYYNYSTHDNIWILTS